MKENAKRYCYKVKSNFRKTPKNFYETCPIEKLGFSKIINEFDQFEGGWAKNVEISPDTFLGRWEKSNIEKIYKSRKDEKEDEYIKELLKEGYEFNEDGTLKENEKTKEKIKAQVCIMSKENEGFLYINYGGMLELYETDTLDECVPDVIQELLMNQVIYKKLYREK